MLRPFRWRLVFAAGVCMLGATALAAQLRPASLPPAVSTPVVSLDAAGDAGAGLPRLYSLLVSWRGELLLERYYNGARATRPANIKSAAKSVISALVGIAIEQGALEGVRQPIAAFFPDHLQGDNNSAKRVITIEDLLTMRSGLESTSNINYGAWVQSGNWVRHALTRSLIHLPGTEMVYSTGNTHLLSAILTKSTGGSTWQFAQEALAKPLGFSLPQWPRDPQGIYFGGNDMLLTPRQMLAFGETYLNGGRSGEKQIVPAAWVKASLVPRVQSRREADRYYGYGWWIRELGGRQAIYAWGYGGQYIFLVPSLDLVVVTTSSSSVGEERRGHRMTVFDLVEHLIIAPVAATNSATAARRVQ
ncbi:MAG: serine hydrolase [Acidobacteria bacterium]|nr:serine hydrolase [Acidobacteriota bacterium]